ncbi:MAG: protein phosphatase 2C domain-containing protein [Scytolyngbya sp. HA4215-MV1]|jgi:hypothetical protein|nr:protein phosphatase 2C domain-containing protein [Scytolyngbya sp. HA4215-MV1]
MNRHFEVAAGSISGREHLRVGKNNQDACAVKFLDQAVVAVVCDGCGSAAHSEVGAKLGSQMTIAVIGQMLEKNAGKCGNPGFWQQVQEALLQRLDQLIVAWGDDRPQAIRDYWLFTIVGTVITSSITTVFALGDGTIVLNGQVLPLPTFANNAPPYLAYGLMEPQQVSLAPIQLQFQIHACLPTQEVQSMVIGSDGVQDLIAAAERPLPGRAEWVGALDQFWLDDRYFRNPDQIRRRLALMNREVAKPDWQRQQMNRESGLLPDDTTLVVLRRKGRSGR